MSATNSSRIFFLSLLGELRYLAPTASINSLRVVMLIRLCLVTLSCSRQTVWQVANYVRQQGISGNNSDESMRGAAVKIVDAGHATAPLDSGPVVQPLEAPETAERVSAE